MVRDDDAFGHALLDWAMGGSEPETIERDDHYEETGAGPSVYLSGSRGWPAAERKTLRFVRGRVIDVGCGAGRIALALQQKGHDVVAMDRSPLALKAAELYGVEHLECSSIEHLSRSIHSFDTVILFGNNFGLFETPERARTMLKECAESANPGTRILAESTSAYFGAPAMDRTYYRTNRERGLPPGQLRARYKYGEFVSPWFRWLFVSRSEMAQIVRGTGWKISKIVGSNPSEPYVAVLERA